MLLIHSSIPSSFHPSIYSYTGIVTGSKAFRGLCNACILLRIELKTEYGVNTQGNLDPTSDVITFQD